jgi:hypothetical protein
LEVVGRQKEAEGQSSSRKQDDAAPLPTPPVAATHRTEQHEPWRIAQVPAGQLMGGHNCARGTSRGKGEAVIVNN